MTHYAAAIAEKAYSLAGAALPAVAQPVFLIILAVVCFTILAGYAILAGWMERKLIGRVHSRIGPMYTGKAGLLQTAADAMKFLKKEVIYPRGSDRALFALAPILLFMASFLTILFIPLASFTIISSPYSLLIVLALLSITPIGILVAAWASNSKYSTLGGLRSASMTMAYEVLLAVSVASVILVTHSFSIQDIVLYQASNGIWLALWQPVGFVLFVIAAVASVERNPMDLTEAESELVSGWRTEYGAVYFSLLLLAEYAKLFLVVVLLASLFLGGWSDWAGEAGFIIKIIALTALMIYIRATAMRLRIDQLLHDLWTTLIPLGIINFIVTLGIMQMLRAI